MTISEAFWALGAYVLLSVLQILGLWIGATQLIQAL